MNNKNSFKNLYFSFVTVLLLFVLTPVFSQDLIDDRDDDSGVFNTIVVPNWYPKEIQRKVGWPERNAAYVDKKSFSYQTGIIDPLANSAEILFKSKLQSNPEKALKELVGYLQNGSENDFVTIKRIHDWIGLHVSYNSDSFCGRTKGDNKPLSVASTGLATCGGFANLFKLMCDLAEIECKTIAGYSKTYISGVSKGENAGLSNHVWNAVKIQNQWYIVDPTTASRRGYEFGKLSQLREYRDANLFVSPLAKMLGNLANKPENVHFEPAFTKETFLSYPKLNQKSLTDGIVYDFSELPGKFEKIGIMREKSDLAYLHDAWLSEGKIGIIKLEVPSDVAIQATLKDQKTGLFHPLKVLVEQKDMPFTASEHTDRETVRIKIAPSEEGIYTVSIRSANLIPGSTPVFKQIYSFQILQSKPSDSKVVFSENTLYPQISGRLYHLPPLEVSKLQLLPEDPNWLYVDIPEHPGIEYYASLKDPETRSSVGKITSSWIRPTVQRFYLRPPAKGTSQFFLYVKPLGDKNKFTDLWYSAYPSTEAQTKLPSTTSESGKYPFYTPILKKSFYEAGLNIIEPLSEDSTLKGSFTLGISTSKIFDNQIDHGLRPLNGKNIPLGSILYLGKDTKTAKLQFLVPNGLVTEYSARLSARQKNGKSETVLTIALPPNPNNPKESMVGQNLWQPGVIYQHSEFPSGAIQVQSLNTDLERFSLAMESNDSYEFSYSVYDQEGKKLTNKQLENLYQISHVAKNQRVMIFNPKINIPVRVLIYTKAKGDSKTSLAHSILIPSKSTSQVDSEPSLSKYQFTNKPICYKLFAEKDFTLLDWEIQKYSVTVRFMGPEDLNLVAQLRNKENKNIKGEYTTNYSRGIWTITYQIKEESISSEDRPIFGRLYLKDSNNKQSSLLSIYIN